MPSLNKSGQGLGRGRAYAVGPGESPWGRSVLYHAVVFQRPSLQLTEDQSEPARGWGHLSRSSPAPPLQLGPLLPVPQPLGPAPALLSPQVWLPY